MIEIAGFAAVCAMVVSYALEDRARIWTLVFAISCGIAALYACVIGSYPFMMAEAVWALIALRKWSLRGA